MGVDVDNSEGRGWELGLELLEESGWNVQQRSVSCVRAPLNRGVWSLIH